MTREPTLAELVADLGPSRQRALARLLGVDETAVDTAASTAGSSREQQLIAFVRLRPGAVTDGDELRSYLAQLLPGYAIPARYITVDAIPRTATGKLDRRALQLINLPQATSSDHFVEPRSQVERDLAEIWKEVLALDSVSVHDSFLEVGGDSISCMQIVSRARRKGLQLTLQAVFDHPTIAELARATTRAATGDSAGGGADPAPTPDGGPIPLTPIQEWFFDQRLAEPGHWNQSIVLEVPTGLARDVLERAVGCVLAHHDQLRARFVCDTGSWRQIIDDQPTVRIGETEVTALTGTRRTRAVAARSAQVHAGFCLSDGGLFQVELFRDAERAPVQVLLVAHHLVIDVASWPIVVADLESACRQVAAGREVTLPATTTSYRAWSRHLIERGAAVGGPPERDRTQPARDATIPLDFDPPGVNTEASARRVTVALDAGDSRLLLAEVPRTTEFRSDEIVVAALAATIGAWTRGDRVRIDIESHGRLATVPDIDLSRTVGWFTSLYPVCLQLAEEEDHRTLAHSIAAQLRAVPDLGVDHGVARYLGRGAATEEPFDPPATPAGLLFNYFGHARRGASTALLQQVDDPNFLAGRSPRNLRSHVIDVAARVVDGRLQVDWTFGSRLHRETTIAALAGEFLTRLQRIVRELAHLAPGADSGQLRPRRSTVDPASAAPDHRSPA